MSETSVYAVAEPDDPEAVHLVTRTYRANGYKEQSLRIPNDQIDAAIEALQRLRLEPSSAPETVKPPFEFGISALCEEHLDVEGYCAYHRTFHKGS